MNHTNSSANSSYCIRVLHPYVYNLTSSYADQRNEATMVFTSVVMFLLAALFFNLNLFSGFSDVSAILNPSVRLFLSTSLSLFLPVMSYLFSEAKNEGAAMASTYTYSSDYSQRGAELSLRARTILMWMLLVEVLRKKVEAILGNAGVKWYSGTIDRAARIAWLGYLVFYNLTSAGKKAIYGILWVFAAAKLVQRVAINRLLKHSFAYGKNALLIKSYMAQILQQPDEQDMAQILQRPDEQAGNVHDEGVKLLKMCKYVVMGEETLERVAGPKGFCLELNKTPKTIVTVGDIWTLAYSEDQLLDQQKGLLRRLSLSFALYKMLRRRFEGLPITGEETRNCSDLIFRGLCREKKEQEPEPEMAPEMALFQVLDKELQFLCEYYHSVLPVVLCNSFFFLANYILFPILVAAFCLLTFILCGNGDVHYVFLGITSENYIISTGMMRVVGCLLRSIVFSPQALFTTVDISVTILLVLTAIYEEVWEFLVFILSNWFMVSMLCNYTAHDSWRGSRVFNGVIRCILWVRSMMSQPKLRFKQFSVLGFRRLLSLTLDTKAVPKEVKKSILDHVLAHVESYRVDKPLPLSNGRSALDKHQLQSLSESCDSESVAEVILTWHIATSLFELNCPRQSKEEAAAFIAVATMLSKYCAYLVAFHPDLLPDEKEGTERVYKAMKKDLKAELGCWCYHLSSERTKSNKMLQIAAGMLPDRRMTVVLKGAQLGKTLVEKAGQEPEVWKLLADLWTELMVYVAPSSSELHVKAHKKVLAQGGEFITVLWVLCTHTGINRPSVASSVASWAAPTPANV